MRDALLVFLGGGTGAVLRWGLSLALPAPYGTLLVNVVGSAVLAFLLHDVVGMPAHWRLLLGTGLLGGFTTYSTFNLDVFRALERGEVAQAALIASSTLVLCLGGSLVGWWVAERMG